MHGAAQNHDFVLFGCGDGVLVAHEHDGEYESSKIENIDEIAGLRIGSLYSHHDAEVFIGIASNRATGEVFVLNIDPEAGAMEVLYWQAQEGASPISYAFSYDGNHALILDKLGGLTILSAHLHDGVNELEFEGRVQLSDEDLSAMPDGHSFNMSVAQNGDYVFVSDPIAQHVLMVHIEDMEIEDDVELDFVSATVTWLGIKDETH